jgi:hypothetical protein
MANTGAAARYPFHSAASPAGNAARQAPPSEVGTASPIKMRRANLP